MFWGCFFSFNYFCGRKVVGLGQMRTGCEFPHDCGGNFTKYPILFLRKLGITNT